MAIFLSSCFPSSSSPKTPSSLPFQPNNLTQCSPLSELEATTSSPTAITTSDLQIDLLTAPANASFTFFAPTDSSLFALAMTQSAPAYTATLRYHALPRRLSVSDLNRLPYQVPIPTLLRSQYVSVTRRLRGSRPYAISVNGVGVVLPGLYYGTHVAVHGLGGILTLRSNNEFLYDSPPPLPPQIDRGSKKDGDFADPWSFPPQIHRGSKENGEFANPPADRSIGHPSVSPSNSLIETVDLPFNRVFLVPQRSHNFQVQSPAVTPSASPVLPPVVSSDLTPSMTPTPLIGETAWMTKSEGDLSGRTVKEYEPSDWMSFGFSDGNSNHVDVEDSHPHPNVPQRL